MIEYRELQHMRRVDSPKSRYYIPHLLVYRPDSTTTKLRVVFNASAKNKTGISLNNTLLAGPTLKPLLFETLLRFRQHKIAFSADISKMYRQIAIHPDDYHLQSILWRDDPQKPVETFQLTTLTYGTTTVSYIPTKCFQVLAKQNQAAFPEEANAIAQDFYMDDLLSGADTVKEAIQKRNGIHAILDNANFPL
ncbi:hypothetical protein PGB90_003489 [Kerria lacca]